MCTQGEGGGGSNDEDLHSGLWPLLDDQLPRSCDCRDGWSKRVRVLCPFDPSIVISAAFAISPYRGCCWWLVVCSHLHPLI